MKDVFEGSTATVSVRLTRGKSPSAKSAKLVFTATQGVAIAPATLQLPAKPFVGQASPVKHQVKFPDVPPDKENYEVEYHVEWEGKRYPGPEKWRVWPDAVDLTTKRKIDGKLTQSGNFPVQLVQGAVRKDYLIPMSGNSMLLIPEPAPFDIVVPTPQRFVGWLDGKDKGRTRVLEWDFVPHKARIDAPVPSDGPARVFVNTGSRNEVKVEVQTAGQDGRVAPNQDVFVEVTFENPTRRGKKSPRPTDADYLKERTVAGLDAVSKSGNDLVWKGKIRTGDDARAEFTIFLGKGGGEKCALKVGSTASVEDDERSFETWRKIYVQHTHSGTDGAKAAWPPAKRGPVRDAYRQVFIDIDFTIDGKQDDKIYPADMKIGDRCGWVDGSEIDETPGKQYFIVNVAGDAWEQIAKDLAPQDPKVAGLYINVGACDLMFYVRNVTCRKTLNEGQTKFVWKGSELSGVDSDSLGGLPKGGRYEPRARYLVEGPPPSYTKLAEGDVPRDHIVVSSSPKSDRGSFTVKLPESVIATLPSDGRWKVRFNIDAMMKVKGAGGYVGYSDGGSSIMLSEAAKGNADTNNTVIHEIGHAIGMCGTVALLAGGVRSVNRLPDYTLHRKTKKDGSQVEDSSYKEHSRWYSHRGHLGNHCATGLGGSAYDEWGDLSSMLLKNVKTFSCVIYGADQVARTPLTYCAECSDMLKAMEVWVGEMPKAG